uniref:Uncharacterized protein n=1 Tax=Meloidogyne hapla TaxID=6305 RepID=A0A1I8AZP6_MELHA
MYFILLKIFLIFNFNLISAQINGQHLNNNNPQLEQFLNQQQSHISGFPSNLRNDNFHFQQNLLIPQNVKSTDKTSIFPSSQLPFDGVPPGFETVLPIEILQKLRELHKNKNIPLSQKQSEFDKIMTSVSPKILSKLPLPSGFEALPSNIQEKIKEINGYFLILIN